MEARTMSIVRGRCRKRRHSAQVRGSRAVPPGAITGIHTTVVRGRGISMDPLHSQHYLRIKSCFTFFQSPNLHSYLSILPWVLLRFIQPQVGRTTRLTSFFIDAVQALEWPRPRSNFYFFHISVFRSGRFVNKFSDNETERFVTSSRLV